MDDELPSSRAHHSYNVKGGDTLWNISRHQLNESGIAAPTQHEVKLELTRILALNSDAGSPIANGERTRIYPGMQLNLPEITLVDEDKKAAKQGAQPESNQFAEVQAEQLSSSVAQQVASRLKAHPHHLWYYETDSESHNYLHGLHKFEHKMLSFGREAIDGVNHWLREVAANAFIMAKHEAEAHGIHIRVNSAGRTYGQQARLYHQLHGHSPVAFPGTSNHETGLAIDVANWREAKPYLLAHGFVHGDGNGPIKSDLWHFKYVGKKMENV